VECFSHSTHHCSRSSAPCLADWNTIIFATILAAIYGLLFGSFANAVAYRVPRSETLMTRSHCPKCDSKITAWQNIPVFSWLFLGGKCKNCKQPISIQYPLVELATALLFGAVAFKVVSLELALLPTVLTIVAYCALVFFGVVLAIIDFKEQLLPSKLIYMALAIVVPLLTISALLMGDYSQILTLLAGAAITAGFLFLIWLVAPGALGFGDVRLGLLTGAAAGWMGWTAIFLAAAGPWMLAAIVLLPFMVAGSIKAKTKVPFGPWILLACFIAICLGDLINIITPTFGAVAL